MRRVTIKELRLRDYRAFADARLVLDDVTFLVGRNGTGKTTVMDAFAFVSEAVADSLMTALERRGGLEGICRRYPASGAPSDVSIAVVLETEDSRRDKPLLYGFTLGKEPAIPGSLVKREVLQAAGGAAARAGRVAQFERVRNEFQSARRDLHPVLDGETLVFPLIAGASEVGKLIAEALRRISVYQLSPRAIRSEPKIGSESRPSRDGHNAGDILGQLTADDHRWLDTHLAAAISGLRGVPRPRAGESASSSGTRAKAASTSCATPSERI